MAATLFSWLALGAWFGWGYCLCTDWHFQIRRQLGIHAGESSYTQLLFHQIPGATVSRQFADTVTVIVLLLILLATAVTWVRQWRKSGPVEPDRLASEPENPIKPI